MRNRVCEDTQREKTSEREQARKQSKWENEWSDCANDSAIVGPVEIHIESKELKEERQMEDG